MTVRIVVTGGECTGKTTLAESLAAHLRVPCVAEAAREYAEEARHQGRALSLATVEPIARRHIAADAAALRTSAAPLLVLDTDLISTVAYSRHYYSASSAWLESEAGARLGALYLLCAPDIPWTPDGVRDRPDDREGMFAHFADVLAEFGAHVHVVRGLGAARVQAALTAVATTAGVRAADAAGIDGTAGRS